MKEEAKITATPKFSRGSEPPQAAETVEPTAARPAARTAADFRRPASPAEPPSPGTARAAAAAAALRPGARVVAANDNEAENAADEAPWEDETSGLPARQSSGSLIPPPPDNSGATANDGATWIKVSQENRCFYIARDDEYIEPGTALFFVLTILFERILWGDGNVVLDRYVWGDPDRPWKPRRELLPPAPPKGVRDPWQMSGRLKMIAPNSGEPFDFLSSGKWGYGMVERLAHKMTKQRERYPGANPLIRLDLKDGKPRSGERPYVYPVFPVLSWRLPDDTEIDP